MSASLSPGSATENKFIVVYSGPGSASDCVKETHQRLKAELPIDPCQLLTTDLSTIFKNRIADRTIVAIPGGNASTMLGCIDPECKKVFRNDAVSFLKAGGCLHGTCAGGIALSSGLYVQFGDSSSERYHLFGKTVSAGCIDAVSEVPMHYSLFERTYEDSFYTDVVMSDSPILPESLRNKTVRLFDAASPGWIKLGASETVLGRYKSTRFKQVPAIITRTLEKGKIWVQGPHPEIGTSPFLLSAEEEHLRKELFFAGFRYLGLKI